MFNGYGNCSENNPGWKFKCYWFVFQDYKLNGMATSWKKIQGENQMRLFWRVVDRFHELSWQIDLLHLLKNAHKQLNSVWDNPRKYNMIKQTKHARMQREIVCSDEWHQTHVKMEKQIKKGYQLYYIVWAKEIQGTQFASRLTSTTLRNDTPLWFMEGYYIFICFLIKQKSSFQRILYISLLLNIKINITWELKRLSYLYYFTHWDK